MARAVPTSRKALNTALAWGVALLIAFPGIALWLPRQAGYQG